MFDECNTFRKAACQMSGNVLDANRGLRVENACLANFGPPGRSFGASVGYRRRTTVAPTFRIRRTPVQKT